MPLYLGYALFQLIFETIDWVMPIVGFVLFTRSRWTPTWFKAYLGFMFFGGPQTVNSVCTEHCSSMSGRPAVGTAGCSRLKILDGLRAATFSSIWLLHG